MALQLLSSAGRHGALAPGPCCMQDTDRGRDWVLDVAITCTEGRWGNGVSSIFVNGRLSVEGGNITVPAVPTLVSGSPGPEGPSAPASRMLGSMH